MPSARPNPFTDAARALIVNTSPTVSPCVDNVVTVIKLAPIPLVPADASVITDTTGTSLPGISYTAG